MNANPELKKKNVDILYGPSKIFPAMWQKKKIYRNSAMHIKSQIYLKAYMRDIK